MKRVLWILTASFLLSVISFAADFPDRTAPPSVGEPRPFDLPELQSFQLSNGLEVLLLEKHQVPIVQINLLLEAGRVQEVEGQYGLASLTANLLDEGAGDMSALELADEMSFLGARFGVSSRTHVASINLRVPVGRLPAALGLVSDVLLRPALDTDELERLRGELLTELLSQHDEPNVISQVLYNRTLFGESHAYGRTDMGGEAFLRRVTIGDIRGFYEDFYRPNNATLVVVGDVTAADVRPLLENAFGEWESREVNGASIPQVFQVEGRKIFLVDKPGAAQSVIRIGRLGARRDTKDYYSLEVLNTILGGAFTSRLMQNLREDKGYSYGARSRFSYGRSVGPFTASSAVQTDVTGPSLFEFMKELNAIMEPVSQDELDRSRNYLAMRFPQRFLTVSSVASQLEDLYLFGLPKNEYDSYVSKVLAVTGDDLTRVANEYLDPENMIVVIVGDRAVIEEQVREQNIGEINFLTVVDVLGPAPDLSSR